MYLRKMTEGRVILPLIFSFMAPLRAQQTPQICSSATTMASMRACEDHRYAQASRDLNATYAKLLQQSSPASRVRLAASQAAWLRFRNTTAVYEAATAGSGTLAPLLQVTTLAQMSEARTLDLRKHLR